MKKYIISRKTTSIKRFITKVFCAFTIVLFTTGCNDYLDQVPDDIANLDHAFSNKYNAERFLFSCYAGLSTVGDLSLLGTDDVWLYSEYAKSARGTKLVLGNQNISSPIYNIWNGANGAPSKAYNNIYNCNIFIERASDLSQIPDLDGEMRKRWIGEAKFLKAYFHFNLFRQYGPIPVLRKNYSPQETAQNTVIKREPVDEVVEYIAALLDEAAADLPLVIYNGSTELGRPTRGASLMLKAKLLMTAASPLFNGNDDYKKMVDKDGVHLFSQQEDNEKWKRAADACKEALDNIPGVDFYKYNGEFAASMSEQTLTKMRTRGVVTDRWNVETIWGRNISKSECTDLQQRAMITNLNGSANPQAYFWGYYSPTINFVERFYTSNGVPIDEDKNWDYENRYKTSVVSNNQMPNLVPNTVTANLNIDRELRFYGSMTFDGSMLYMKFNGGDENNAVRVNTKFGAANGRRGGGFYNATGYFPTKLAHFSFEHINSAPAFTTDYYNWPEMRLADLYLLYAEALNEIGQREEAIRYIDEVRKKASLDGVVDSWKNHSRLSNKVESKEGLREIIHQEREIELAFEGHSIWDLRRWKETAIRQNVQLKGWNQAGLTPESYYTITPLADISFVSPRDYLWPIQEQEMLRNKNLVQNPGW